MRQYEQLPIPACAGIMMIMLERKYPFPSACLVETEHEDERPLRILIADDHGIMRSGLRTLLEGYPGLTVVGEAADGDGVVGLAEQLCADLVLLDIKMPGLDGIEVTKALKAARPGIIVLILTAYEDAELLRAALNAGASGYMVKRAAELDLLEAIRRVGRGDVYVHPSVLSALPATQAQRGAVRGVEELIEPLTLRELDVLKLVALGYTTAEIGAQLSLSARTVEHHRAHLKDKIGAHTRAELTRYAAEHGLLPPDKAPF
jgi:two-component system, NarL family, response regulator NreC